ncbi:GFA family protein [Microbulbifer sp. M83]|uniref:GFA family protein n=1 Tax=Microbulbifer sp. M83 TaxID=3118246 RepID=UPI003FA53A39
MCHCQACQRRTGSVFGVQGRFPAEAVELHGEWREYRRTADSGNCLAFRFCPASGATLFLVLDIEPGLIGFPVGAFTDPGLPEPTASIYESSCHSWVKLPDNIEHRP